MRIFYVGQGRTRVCGEAYSVYVATGNYKGQSPSATRGERRTTEKRPCMDGHLIIGGISTIPSTVMTDNEESIKIIAEQIARGGRNIFFTGAGISTESGISDYRSKGGIWDKFRPVYFDEFMTSKESRIEYWHQKH